MADQKVDVTSPISIMSDSKQRVAYDLMNKIDSYSNIKSDQKDKKYWFTLYRQCHKAVNNASLEGILKEE